MTTATIFLAEDDVDVRALIARALNSDGYELREAASGTALLELLAHATPLDRPDVIVADVFMPGYSGLGILAAVRGAGWSTPVILMTGRCDAALREVARTLGATAFIEKPFDVADLRVAVLNALTHSR